ncbi:hypothetical protein UPYG_G00073420 [Umbra pygmaea]|uniref:BHLH domain-containing protein n=1 Tax=Umbra pygmaea TaxID=75934 RepID=A0ABD0XC65_UMBPY
MPEMTENQTPGHTPRKKKNKESHNAVERQRKEKINAGINRIGDLLPCSQALKQSKNMILDQAHRYITDLQKQNDAMLLERGDRIQAEEIRRLRRQLEELRKESGHYIELLKAHNINFLDDPTIHWKGKLRCAKVAKVTPTHQLPKGIILYSNGNVICPAGKEASPAADLGKQTTEAVIVQSSGDIRARMRVNGAVQHASAPSSAPPLLPGANFTPTVSTPGITLMEQCVAEAPSTPKLPPSVSYITLQGLCPAPMLPTTLPQLATSTQSITVSASLASPVPSLTALPQVLTTQNAAFRTLSYTTIPSSSTFLRASAAGSTQTTWTTLQLAGNTVQPVCKSLLAPETSTTGPQGIQHLPVGPVVTKPSVQPVHIQMRPQAPITAHIQAQSSIQRTSQLRPAILAQTQPLLVPQPQCTVLPQPPVRPQSAVLAQSTVVSQPPAAVLQQAAVLPHPQTTLITQPQPALVPQAQPPTVLPLLQTMQVLQVNPAGTTTVAGVTTPQNTNNPSVVILQQANPCSAQSVVREDLPSQNPCQHIVIIQASNQHPPAPPQNPSVGIVTAAAPVVPSQSVVTSGTTSTTGQQIVGGKQLVHILPRPVPQIQPSPAHQASPAPLTPHTITVNGQVFALQPMQTSDKPGSQGGQGSLQLIQPSSMEEPTTNVALHTLGALSSLNQSISQGMPQCSSTHNAAQLAPATPSYPIVPPGQPPASVTATQAPRSSPAKQIQIPSRTPPRPGLAVAAGKASLRPPATALVSRARKDPAKRTTLVRKKVQRQGRGGGSLSAKPVNTSGDRQKQVDSVAQGTSSSSAVNIQPHPSPASTSVNPPQGSTYDAPIPPSTPVGGSFSSSQATPTANLRVNDAVHSEAAASTAGPAHTGSLVTSVTPCSSVVSVGTTQTQLTLASSVSLATVTPVSASADKPPDVGIDSPHPLRSIVTQKRQTASIGAVPPSAATNGNSKQSRSMVTRVCSSVTNSSCVTTTAVCGHSVCTVSAVAVRPVVSVQTTQLTSSQPQKQPASSQKTLPSSQPKPVASPLPAPTPTSGLSAPVSSPPSVSVPMTMPSEYRKRVTYNRPSTQLVATSSPTTPHLTELKVAAFPSTVKDVKQGHPGTAVEIVRTDAAASRKDSAVLPNVYMLDHEPLDQALPLSRQSDSPMSGAAGSGRGFSVASMLPTGHSTSASSGHSVGVSSGHSIGVSSGHSVSVSPGNSIGTSSGHSVGVSSGHSVCASSGTFGTFTFTTEQADILAMLEQESPGRRVAGCTLDNPDSTHIPTWEPNLNPDKPLHASNSKERGAGQQTKLIKQMETPVARPTSQGSARGEVACTGPSVARHPQNIYSQNQSQAQSGTVGTLSVNNLIHPSSRQQQVYPGSPILSGQQGPTASPASQPPPLASLPAPVHSS